MVVELLSLPGSEHPVVGEISDDLQSGREKIRQRDLFQVLTYIFNGKRNGAGLPTGEVGGVQTALDYETRFLQAPPKWKEEKQKIGQG